MLSAHLSRGTQRLTPSDLLFSSYHPPPLAQRPPHTHTFLSQGNGLQGDQGGDLSPWQMTCSGPVLPPWGHFLPVGNGSGQLPQPFWERCPLTSLVSLDTIRSARAHPENGHPGVLVTQYTGNGKSSHQLPLQLITAQLHSASS